MEKLLHERLREWAETPCPLNRAFDEYETDEYSYDDEVKKLFTIFADEIERCYIPRPRFEDGEPVKFGSNEPDWVDTDNYDPQSTWWVTAISQQGIPLATAGSKIVARATMTDDGFVKRPAQKVYDADGVVYKRGETVFNIKTGDEYIVESLDECAVKVKGDETWWCNDCFTHKRPVFDAEGVRIRKGDTVWSVEVPTVKGTVTDIEFKVGNIVNIVIAGSICEKYNFPPEKLTHREPDSLEKLRDDMVMTHDAADEPCSTTEEWADRLTALIERGA